jgi:hypothetical protein
MQKITYDIDAENDKKFMTGFNTFADFEEAFINMSLGEIPRLRHHLKEKEKIRDSCKWAVLTNSQTVFNFISMVIPELKLSKIKIKLFKNKQNALEWLLN